MPRGHSRAKVLQKKLPDEPLPLPETDCPELTGYLFAAGPTQAGSMGEIPLTAQELAAWARGSGAHLTGWEFQTILDASSAYVSEKYAAKDPMRPSPMVPEMTEERKAAVVEAMERYFDAVK